MPIYEFYCATCHTVFHFLARRPGAPATPSCPRCRRTGLERRASTFSISRGRPEPGPEGSEPDLDDPRLERAMESLADEAGSLGDDDPKAAARFMRRLYETAGLPVGAGLSEALRRLEAGEDPDAVEDELGDVLDGDAPVEPGRAPRALRRLLPPRVDPELHEI